MITYGHIHMFQGPSSLSVYPLCFLASSFPARILTPGEGFCTCCNCGYTCIWSQICSPLCTYCTWHRPGCLGLLSLHLPLEHPHSLPAIGWLPALALLSSPRGLYCPSQGLTREAFRVEVGIQRCPLPLLVTRCHLPELHIILHACWPGELLTCSDNSIHVTQEISESLWPVYRQHPDVQDEASRPDCYVWYPTLGSLQICRLNDKYLAQVLPAGILSGRHTFPS